MNEFCVFASLFSPIQFFCLRICCIFFFYILLFQFVPLFVFKMRQRISLYVFADNFLTSSNIFIIISMSRSKFKRKGNKQRLKLSFILEETNKMNISTQRFAKNDRKYEVFFKMGCTLQSNIIEFTHQCIWHRNISALTFESREQVTPLTFFCGFWKSNLSSIV